MRSYNMLKIEMDREQKEVLAEAAEILIKIESILAENKANGHTPWQEGLLICDDFWKIYSICTAINDMDLIP